MLEECGASATDERRPSWINSLNQVSFFDFDLRVETSPEQYVEKLLYTGVLIDQELNGGKTG